MMASGENQYLTFVVHKETFGIKIDVVREIIGYGDITHIPMMPGFIHGVINLRDKSVPVIDLGRRFHDEKSEITRLTCIIIISLELRGREMLLGLLVDSVNEVITFSSEELEPRPDFSDKIHTEFIEAMARINDKFIIILNMKEVLNFEDFHKLHEAATKGHEARNSSEAENSENKETENVSNS